MTSTPISAGIKPYFPGVQGPQASANGDVDNSFSDVLKNQKNDTSKDARTTEAGKSANQPKPERRAEKISPAKNRDALQKKSGEAAPEEEAAVLVDEAVQAAAGQMVMQTAEQLGITENEVVQILDDLSLEPVDLLNTENLQQVVLAAAGETDATSLVTDETLFEDFKNLTDVLEVVTEETAAATGMEVPEVKEAFAEFTASAEKPVLTDETKGAAPEIALSEAPVEAREPKEDAKPVQEARQMPQAETVEEKAEPVKGEDKSATDGKPDRKESASRGDAAVSFAADEKFAEAPVRERPVEEAPRFDQETTRIMDQITDYMRGQVKEGMSELEMQLHPESLGSLHVRLTAKDGAVTAQFTAQNDTVKAVLESQMIQLKDTFKEQGITVEAIEIAVASHRFDENLHQGSGDARSDQRQEARPRTRRINLNLSGDGEDLTEEEQLAAEILRANGGTVDYTA